MTYNAVVSLEARIPAQLNRCWTEDPIMLEDALGRKMRFCLDFIDSWEVGRRICGMLHTKLTSKAFESSLEVRFRGLPGHRKIEQKEYALRANVINKDVDRYIHPY